MAWNLLVAALGALAGLSGVLYAVHIRSTEVARETARQEVSDRIVSALALFETHLVTRLDKDYRRKVECNLMMYSKEDSHV